MRLLHFPSTDRLPAAVLKTMLLLLLPALLNGFNLSLPFAAGKGTKPAAMAEPPYTIKTIVIDAGHGGKDPGCSGAHSREKHIALNIALELARQLRANFPGLKVILTRETDVFIPLHERAAIANRNKADLFVSIHCNAMPPGNGTTWGTETYVMGLHTANHNLEVAKRENEVILFEENYEQNYDYDPNSPEGHILLSMFQNAFLEQSIRFAEKIEYQFHASAGRRSRGVKQAGFVVLKESAMPSVLIETGFLTNGADEEFLASEAGQQGMADALLRAFAQYKAEIEGLPAPPLASPPVVANNKPKPADEPKPQTRTEQREELPARAVRVSNPPVRETQQPAETASPQPRPYTPPASPPPAIVPERSITHQTSDRRPLENRPSGNVSGPIITGNSGAAANVHFCVQIAASTRPVDTSTARWRSLGYLIEVIQEGPYFKYQARNLTTLQQAYEARLVLQQRGFDDAFIVVYKDGQRMSLEEAQAELGLK